MYLKEGKKKEKKRLNRTRIMGRVRIRRIE
jgi:hypothetical protein